MEKVCGDLPSFNCILVGESGVGKSSYLMRLLTGEFPGDAVKDEVPIKFFTDRGNICLNILEADFKDLEDILNCKDFDYLIVMYDISKGDHSMVLRIPPVLFDICIPSVVIGNKRDAVDNGLEFEDGHLMPYFEMSVKHNLNIVEPLQWIIRKLLYDEQLMFVEEYAPWPPEPSQADNCDPEALDGESQPEPSIVKSFLESLILEVGINSPLPEDDGIW